MLLELRGASREKSEEGEKGKKRTEHTLIKPVTEKAQRTIFSYLILRIAYL